MYIIYLMNDEDKYLDKIYKDTEEEIFILFNLYYEIVPKILVTDFEDNAILEIKDGKVSNKGFAESNVEVIQNRIKAMTSAYNVERNIEKLCVLYKTKTKDFMTMEGFSLKEDIYNLYINILALIATKVSLPTSYTHLNIEQLFDKKKIELHQKIESFLPSLVDFSDSSKTLVIMPISRVEFEGRPFCKRRYNFIPPKTIDYKNLFDINTNLFNNDLRTGIRNMTLFSVNTLYNSACIAFTYDLNWEEFCTYPNHKGDITILKLLSDSTNDLFNLISFNGCSLSLPEGLPGEVGAWGGSNDYMGAFLYNIDRGAYYIAGSAIESSRVVKGVGLEIDDVIYDSFDKLLSYTKSEVSQVVMYALSLFKDALYSNNATNKFIRMMTIFEYLAFPHEYQQFKISKKFIFCHTLMNKTQYNSLADRFEVLSKNIRTEIIHNGKTLETIIPDFDEREKLLKELEMYFRKTINAMFIYIDKDWNEFDTYRRGIIQKFTT